MPGPIPTPSFVVVVVRGPDAGARMVVGGTAKTIGRSRSSDLLLSDRGVSRTHCEVVAAPGGLSFRCAKGAAPIVVRGRETTDMLVAAGENVVLADTLLGVVAEAGTAGGDATTVGFLFQGLASDVKSLRSVADLLDPLDAATDRGTLEAAVSTWACAHAGATSARVVLADALAADPDLAPLASGDAHVARALRGSTYEVAVPAPGPSPHALVFTLPATAAGVTDELLRLLVVAGRVVGSALARVSMQHGLEQDVASLRAIAVGSAREFLGRSPAAAEVARLLPRLAASDSTALILGESGTGKSFVARLVHEASKRAREPFRVVNCAAIPDNLVESELFGHERGAFTGAVAAHAGAFEAAARGTILLDELGELPLPSQAKLLHVLEEKKFARVGGSHGLTLQARVLAATNRDLTDMVKKGTFRQDLFYRVSVVSLRVPALRERGSDVGVLAEHLLADLRQTAGRRVTGFSPAAMAALRAYDWPGNVRELRNAVEHALVLGDTNVIEPCDLPATVTAGTGEPPHAQATGDAGDTVALPARLEWLEQRAIEAALRASGGNRAKAAALLGINRVTLYKKLRAEDGKQ